MEATRTLHELGERFLANKKEAIAFSNLRGCDKNQVLQGILPINKDNKLNENVPLASYHTKVIAEQLRNWQFFVFPTVSVYKTVLILSNHMR